MKLNVKTKAQPVYTHEGAVAKKVRPIDELKRSVLACLLWEGQFYESGQTIAERIKTLAHQCDPVQVSELAIKARTEFKIRHASLLLARELVRHPKAQGRLIGDTIYQVVQRVDELAEFLALYWSEGKTPLHRQVKLGLGRAFQKFDEYQLQKWNRDSDIKLRDVLFEVHARPKVGEQDRESARTIPEIRRNDYLRGPVLRHDSGQGKLYSKLVDGQLETPNTWEARLSSGEDKKTVFTDLLKENRLGYMALLRNIRKMDEVGVDKDLITTRLMQGAAKSKALPFRFVAAARQVPKFERELDTAMQLCLEGMEKLEGKTIVLVDVSGSMSASLSSKSDLSRLDAASALAVLVNGVAQDASVYTFSMDVVGVPPRSGMALIDAIDHSQIHGGTYLGQAVSKVYKREYYRLIVITDEQSHDRVPDPINRERRHYMINVASYQHGVGYGNWTHLDGFSEAVVTWIQELERM